MHFLGKTFFFLKANRFSNILQKKASKNLYSLKSYIVLKAMAHLIFLRQMGVSRPGILVVRDLAYIVRIKKKMLMLL